MKFASGHQPLDSPCSLLNSKECLGVEGPTEDEHNRDGDEHSCDRVSQTVQEDGQRLHRPRGFYEVMIGHFQGDRFPVQYQ